jgi:hypothetical protein
MADTLESSGQYIPKDLRITSQPDAVDKNKFQVVIANLKIDKPLVFQFQYVFPDGEVSEWSPGYNLNTSTEVIPGSPSASVASTSSASIPVTLSTFPANAKRVDVYVINGIFGTGKVAYSFFSAGTTTIAAPAGTYQVQLITVTPSGINGTPTQTFSITVTDPTANLVADPSVTPNTPTVSSVVGAIQLSWNGKTASGGDQPNGFKAAKVYVGTSSGFTPVDTGSPGANQVDTLNFANGQNTLNIGVGTLVNGVALTYNTNYYVKIKTTNGNTAQDSAEVSASGNPVQIGKVGSGDIVSILADQITTGTLQSNSTITVGSPGGKRVELRGTGNPFEIFGTGGTSLLSYNTSLNRLTITGDGSFTGAVTATSGSFTGDLYASNGLFKVESGQITATSGKIGDWVINTGKLASSSGASPNIELDPLTPQIVLRGTGSYSGYNITLAPPTGITAGSTFSVTPSGILTSTSGTIGGWTIGPSTLSGGGTTLSSSGSISLTGGTIYGNEGVLSAGNMTLSSGAITNNSTLALTGVAFTYDSDASYNTSAFSYPAWTANTFYAFGSRVTYNGVKYFCVLSHTSTVSITPPSSKSGSAYYWTEEFNGYLFVGNTSTVHIGDRGTYFTDLGAARNALSFRIYSYDVGDGYFGRGYIMTALDSTEFRASSINSTGVGYKTVVVGAYGQLYNGRTFYYGSAGTSSAINTEVGGQIGDVYFSTV